VIAFFFAQKSNSDQVPTIGGSGSANYATSNGGIKGGINNPGFLIHTNINWVGKTTIGSPKLEKFDTLRSGIRAWYINLFGKVKAGTIKNTNQMIDILTPAIAENPEPARINYKNAVAKATNWMMLGKAVFDFEANPDWKQASGNDKTSAITLGLADAVRYSYGGEVPPYFK
jgi:hypothetical protein